MHVYKSSLKWSHVYAIIPIIYLKMYYECLLDWSSTVCMYEAGVCFVRLFFLFVFSPLAASCRAVLSLKDAQHTHTHTHPDVKHSVKLHHVTENTSLKITIPLWAGHFAITSGSDDISGCSAFAYLLSAEWHILSDVTQWPSLRPLLLSSVPQSGQAEASSCCIHMLLSFLFI